MCLENYTSYLFEVITFWLSVKRVRLRTSDPPTSHRWDPLSGIEVLKMVAIWFSLAETAKFCASGG